MSYKKGFTLIELLVVIAIIGILAAVVLASLNTARDSANDATAKVEMSEVRSQAELYYTTNNTYGTVAANANCETLSTADTILEDAQMQDLLDSVASSTDDGIQCAVYPGSYAFEVQLLSDEFFCVDSGGAANEGDATLFNDDTVNSVASCN